MRIPVRAWLYLFGAVGTVAIAVACSSKIPPQPEKNLCEGSQVHVTRVDPNSCTLCLEDKCCDNVGDCARNDACRTAVVQAQGCVLDAGPKAGRGEVENDCKKAHLTGAPGADTTYACMRNNCGFPCGLPVCKLDPGVPSMPSPRCDDCFAQTCCRELNDCSKDRVCLRMLQCIIENCKDDFHTQLVSTNVAAAGDRVSLTCDDAGTVPQRPAPDGSPGPPACFDKCFRDIVEFEAGAIDPDRGRSACLASNAFLCGARADCGQECSFDAGAAPGNDAGDAGVGDAANDADAGDAADASDAD